MRARRQEREVRLTAQRILQDHLHPGGNADSPIGTYGHGISLDVTDATLIDFDLCGCHIQGTAIFTRATFYSAA